MREGRTDDAFHRAGRVLLVRHIPAFICGQCGLFYLDPQEASRVADQFEQFFITAAPCGIVEYEEAAPYA